eukprot:1161971-Pelagomonas_calceolata.AAC.2
MHAAHLWSLGDSARAGFLSLALLLPASQPVGRMPGSLVVVLYRKKQPSEAVPTTLQLSSLVMGPAPTGITCTIQRMSLVAVWVIPGNNCRFTSS